MVERIEVISFYYSSQSVSLHDLTIATAIYSLEFLEVSAFGAYLLPN